MTGERYNITIPTRDPRFAALLRDLRAVKGQGKQSPASRMLVEWALLGYLLTHGRLVVSSAVPAPTTPTTPPAPVHAPDTTTTETRTDAEQHTEQQLDSFLETAGWTIAG